MEICEQIYLCVFEIELSFFSRQDGLGLIGILAGIVTQAFDVQSSNTNSELTC